MFDDTLILFGRSPYINKIADHIPELCEKYHTIGCNYFCNSFPMVENVIFHDDITPNVQEHSNIITNVLYLRRNSNCRQLLENHEKKELYVIHKNGKKFAEDVASLNFCIHTPSLALDWAHKKGFKNVILAGIDLTQENQHFDYKTAPDQYGHTFRDDALIKARKHITDVAAKVLNVYQLNPESNIEIPKIKITDLV